MKYKLIALQIEGHPEYYEYISSVTGVKAPLPNELKFTIEFRSDKPYSKGDSNKLMEKLMTFLQTVEV